MTASIGQKAGLCAALALLSLAAPARAALTEYPVPAGSPAAVPAGVAAGPDGAVWFTERERGMIGRMATDGTVQEFPLPTSAAEPATAKQPVGIALGPDGALWFTQSGVDRIGRITTAGEITEYGGLTAGSQPGDIALGPDGKLWFTEAGFNRGNRVGVIDPATGAVTEFCIRKCDMAEFPSDYGLRPRDITAGPDGRMWFTLENPERDPAQNPYGDQGTGFIAAIDSAGAVTEYAVTGANSRPVGVVTGPDGNVWFTQYGGNKIGRITPSGEITEFPLATPSSSPHDIVTGPDGNLWFTQWGGNRLGRITPDGSLTDSPELPQAFSEPNRIAVGPDEALWFTESGADKIGRQTADAAPIVRPLGVSDVGSDTAKILGSINPSGSATSYVVHYGFDTDFGSTSPAQDAGSAREASNVEVVLKELDFSSVYYYRWEATNAEGTTRSSIGTFTTGPPVFEYPPPPPPPPPLPPAPPPVRPAPDGLALKILRPRPRERPRRFIAKGLLRPPKGENLVDPCLEGVVWIYARKRRTTIKKQRVRGKIVRKKIVRVKTVYKKTTALEEDCTYRTRFKLRRDDAPPGRYHVVARFIGNEGMRAKRSKQREIQIVPRVKRDDRRRPRDSG